MDLKDSWKDRTLPNNRSNDVTNHSPSPANADSSIADAATPVISSASSLLPRLEQLDGFRFLAAFWLVLAHNFDPSLSPVGGYYERFCVRRYVAVSFFIILSGFVSHYAYQRRDFSSTKALRQFYVGRIGSILACYYVTLLSAVAIRMAAGHYTTSYCVQGLILSLLLLQAWVPRFAYFGNTPAWTLSTLVAHWLVYPFLQPRLKGLSEKTLRVLTVVLPFLALVPAAILIWTGEEPGTMTRKHWYALYTHPVIRLPDFLFGSLLAELFLRQQGAKGDNKTTTTLSSTELYIARASDLVFPIVGVLIWAVPYNKRTSTYDSFLGEMTVPLFGLLIYGSSLDPRGTYVGRVMAWNVCRRLGDFAFQVYLWRWPLFAAVHWWEMDRVLKKGWMALSLPYFVPAMIALYIISYLWMVYVDTPIRLYLMRVTRPAEEIQGDPTIPTAATPTDAPVKTDYIEMA